WLAGHPSPVPTATVIGVGITGEDEESVLVALNEWLAEYGLPRGELAYEYTDSDTGEQRAVFDLAWPEGIQEGLSQPVAVLLNEGADVLALASGAGFRCFTDVDSFKSYVQSEVVGLSEVAA